MTEKNKGGRPPKDEAATARAVELCLTEGINPIEACGRVPGATQRTVYLHLERIRKGKMLAPKISRIEVAPEPRPDPLQVMVASADVRSAVTVAADPEKARAVRRLVQGMGGKWDGEAVEALAATWGCSVDAVRALVIEAAILAGAQVLPPELAREESLAVARRARDKAETAADWKSVLLAQAHIDGIQLRAKEGEGLTKAQFVALAREILEAVKPFPGAYEAAIGVMFPG